MFGHPHVSTTPLNNSACRRERYARATATSEMVPPAVRARDAPRPCGAAAAWYPASGETSDGVCPAHLPFSHRAHRERRRSPWPAQPVKSPATRYVVSLGSRRTTCLTAHRRDPAARSATREGPDRRSTFELGCRESAFEKRPSRLGFRESTFENRLSRLSSRRPRLWATPRRTPPPAAQSEPGSTSAPGSSLLRPASASGARRNWHEPGLRVRQAQHRAYV